MSSDKEGVTCWPDDNIASGYSGSAMRDHAPVKETAKYPANRD